MHMYMLSCRDYTSLSCNDNKFCVCALGDDIGKKYHLLCERCFKWNIPSTYPDWFCEISPIIAAEYVIQLKPLEILEAARFHNNIHLSTGVTIPLSIQCHLSTDLRYMLALLPDVHNLLETAYEDFCNKSGGESNSSLTLVIT